MLLSDAHTRSINHTANVFHRYSKIKLKSSAAKDKITVQTPTQPHTRVRLLSLPSPCLLFSSPIVWPSFCVVTADETFGITCLFRFDFLFIRLEQLPLNTHFTNTSFKGTNMRVTHAHTLYCWINWFFFKLRDCINRYISYRELYLYDWRIRNCNLYLNFCQWTCRKWLLLLEQADSCQ